MNNHGERFIARVISVDDPEKANRLKIRIYGIHDDSTQIPDDALPWARCVFPVTNPCHQGVAGASTGMVPNATVVGYFADPHQQIPLVDGCIGMSDGSSTDFPRTDRGEDFNPVVNNSIWHVGTSELKFLNSKTIGPIQYVGQDISQMLTQIGEGNIMSALSSLSDAIDTFNKLKTMVSNSPFDQLNSIVQGFTSDLNSLTDGISDMVITTDSGTVAATQTSSDPGSTTPGATPALTTMPTANTASPSSMVDTTTSLTSGLGTITSKADITSTQDALNRISGHRFVMTNVMPGISKGIDGLRTVFAKE